AVPQGEGKHAAQFLDQPLALVLVEVNEHLGVTLSAEDVSPGFQALSQLLKVVDLSVEHHLDRAVLVPQRLGPAAQVDDRQAAVDKPQAWLVQVALRVGTAVGDGLTHRLENTSGNRSGRICVENARDSAHGGG